MSGGRAAPLPGDRDRTSVSAVNVRLGDETDGIGDGLSVVLIHIVIGFHEDLVTGLKCGLSRGILADHERIVGVFRAERKILVRLLTPNIGYGSLKGPVDPVGVVFQPGDDGADGGRQQNRDAKSNRVIAFSHTIRLLCADLEMIHYDGRRCVKRATTER